jgi:hypothetical protein
MTDQKISFNGGRELALSELIQECEPVMFWSATAVRPNTSWRYTDENGHQHRWKRNDDDTWRVTKSTTRTEHVPCDGSCGDPDCDGWDLTVYECSKCGERLEPGWSPDNGMKSIPGPRRITAVVHGPITDLPQFNARASFAITEGGKASMRGTARVIDMNEAYGHAEARVNLIPVEATHA